jgi:hypothetical protein
MPILQHRVDASNYDFVYSLTDNTLGLSRSRFQPKFIDLSDDTVFPGAPADAQSLVFGFSLHCGGFLPECCE